MIFKINTMKRNMGTVDRAIRILAAVAVVTLYLSNVISGTLAIILLAMSAIFVGTAVLGFCPLYIPLTISTKGKK